MGGTWTIYSIQFTDGSGLNYFPECSGKLFLDNCKESTCTYSLDINYSHPSISGSRTETGTYTLNQAGSEFDLLEIKPDQSTVQHAKNEIVLLTKTDLKFTYQTSTGEAFTYIFRK